MQRPRGHDDDPLADLDPRRRLARRDPSSSRGRGGPLAVPGRRASPPGGEVPDQLGQRAALPHESSMARRKPGCPEPQSPVNWVWRGPFRRATGTGNPSPTGPHQFSSHVTRMAHEHAATAIVSPAAFSRAVTDARSIQRVIRRSGHLFGTHAMPLIAVVAASRASAAAASLARRVAVAGWMSTAAPKAFARPTYSSSHWRSYSSIGGSPRTPASSSEGFRASISFPTHSTRTRQSQLHTPE